MGRHRGLLCLASLTKLSPEVARGLKKHVGRIDLSGVTSLSLEAATELRGTKSMLVLQGVGAPEDGVFLALAQHKGEPGTGFILGVEARNHLSGETLVGVRANRHIYFGNDVVPAFGR